MFTETVFFFQAEDGIRDLTVTGVQTCALPISVTACEATAYLDGLLDRGGDLSAAGFVRGIDVVGGGYVSRSAPLSRTSSRSEERRVGKECRSRWSPYR